MKRVLFFAAGVVLVGGLAAGCSKSVDVPNATGIDANKITADATKCADMATQYAGIWTPLATGGGAATDKEAVQKAIDGMKANVPDKIKTDLDTLGNGIKNAKTPEEVSKFLSSPEYTKADKNVTTYLTTECSKIGS